MMNRSLLGNPLLVAQVQTAHQDHSRLVDEFVDVWVGKRLNIWVGGRVGWWVEGGIGS